MRPWLVASAPAFVMEVSLPTGSHYVKASQEGARKYVERYHTTLSWQELEALTFAENYHRWIIDAFEPYLGETIAEVGAGIGSVSKLLLGKRIKRLFAFEPSHNMYLFLEEALRQEARAKAVNDFFSPRYAQAGFDSVVYINVLEHIQDDRTELAHALEMLNPQGHILLFVPALVWLYSDFDKQVGHFRRYTKQDLSGLVRDVGFTLVKAQYFDLAG